MNSFCMIFFSLITYDWSAACGENVLHMAGQKTNESTSL